MHTQAHTMRTPYIPWTLTVFKRCYVKKFDKKNYSHRNSFG